MQVFFSSENNLFFQLIWAFAGGRVFPVEVSISYIYYMKVLKFGGTSVGSVNSMLSVKKIIESVDDNVIVVVSALGESRIS